MAFDMSIKVNGIDGESKIKGHEGEIDVLAWSFGVSNSGNAHVGGGAGAGKCNVQDVSFTKWVDLASCKLMLHVCDGTHIPDAKLTVRKAGGEALDYLTIEMKEILVTSVSTGGSGGEDRLTENVTFNFAKLAMKYKSQSATGSGEGEDEMTWDIPANCK